MVVKGNMCPIFSYYLLRENISTTQMTAIHTDVRNCVLISLNQTSKAM